MAPPQQLPTRPLGKMGPRVPRMGVGLMNLAGFYGQRKSEEARQAFLDRCWGMGATFWDTADIYGDNEDMLGKWFTVNPDKRSDIFLATKFGNKGRSADSSPESCRVSIERSLARLGLSYVDLYYVHVVDLETPIELTVRAMAELQREGKVRHLGLSNVSAATLRRACAVAPIACVQMEYSAFELSVETQGVFAAARELGVAVVAYSPLGKGLLTGSVRSAADVSGAGDLRAALPWMAGPALAANLALVDKISEMARAKGATTVQLALAWMLAQGEDVFPLPGTTSEERLAENLGALGVGVTQEEQEAIRHLADQVERGGMLEPHLSLSIRDTPPLLE